MGSARGGRSATQVAANSVRFGPPLQGPVPRASLYPGLAPSLFYSSLTGLRARLFGTSRVRLANAAPLRRVPGVREVRMYGDSRR